MDIFVAISERNAKALVRVFADFGFSDIGLAESDFLDDETIVEIGREPVKIQVLTGIDWVAFEDGGLPVPFISLDCLIANESATPRAKDKIDLEELRTIRDAQRHHPQREVAGNPGR